MRRFKGYIHRKGQELYNGVWVARSTHWRTGIDKCKSPLDSVLSQENFASFN